MKYGRGLHTLLLSPGTETDLFYPAQLAALAERVRKIENEVFQKRPQLECVFPAPQGKPVRSERTAGLEERFRHLARIWKEETRFCSSIARMVLHKAYLQIIGMGPAAVPLILRELSLEPDEWFSALESITAENPVPEDARGRLDEMSQAWLAWGRERGYV
jgi:hypothetical protein